MNPTKNLIELKLLMNPTKNLIEPKLLMNPTKSLSSIRFLVGLAFRPCELLSSLFVSRSSVNISHFNLLLRNHWADCNQTLVEWSLDDPLPKLCPVASEELIKM